MSLTLLEPVYLLCLTLIPLCWILPRRTVNVRHALVRSLLLLFLVLGLARPVLLSADEAPRHVLILDRSPSVEDAGAAAASRAAARILAAIPRPASTILLDMAAPDRGELGEELDADEIGRLDGRQSSISSALTRALRMIPRGSPAAITLISDGMATDSHHGDVLVELEARDIPLHVVELPASLADPRPVGLDLPDTLRVGHGAIANARLVGGRSRVTLSLMDGEDLLARREGLILDGAGSVALAFEPKRAGFRDYRLLIEVESGLDADPDNDELVRRVAVQDPLRLLYLGQRMEGGAEKISDLLGRGFAVEEGAPAGAMPEMQSYDLVMLDDLPATELRADWQEAIIEAMRERGTGLFASGGRAAFGPGGYAKTAIESALPVETLQKEEKKDPSTTLAIIIDTSGSMTGMRMTLAKQVARLAMRRLQPHDKVGIVEFYGTKQWAAPIQSAANQIDLQRALNRLGAEGGTVLMPAIEEAYYALKNVQTRYKHVLILTDAGVETGPYEALCRRMSDEGMTVSTVLVGPGRHSDFLVELADWGGGRYYNAADRFNLPELLLKKPSTSVLPAYRPEQVTLEGSAGRGWWGEIDPSDVPVLDGYVETELRPGAERLIATTRSEKPVLASWVNGLGRATAFMSEPTGPGTRSWADWEGYGALLGRVLARTARGAQEPFEFRLERRGSLIRIEARRNLRADLAPAIAILGEDGSREGEVDLREVAPGLHRGELDWPVDRALDLVGSVAGREGFERRLVSGAREDLAPETQVDPARRFPLAGAAAATGGRIMAPDAASFQVKASRGSAPMRMQPIGPWLLLAAILAFMADVFLRRRADAFQELDR